MRFRTLISAVETQSSISAKGTAVSYCNTGDAPATRDAVATGIEIDEREDKKDDEEVEKFVENQGLADNLGDECEVDEEYDDNNEIVENKPEAKHQSNQLPPDVIDIKALD